MTGSGQGAILAGVTIKCVECFKVGRDRVEAEYTHLGKSLCAGCLPASLDGGREIVKGLESLQDDFRKLAQESAAINSRLRDCADALQNQLGEANA